jgi:methionyl-tRNA synthetase
MNDQPIVPTPASPAVATPPTSEPTTISYEQFAALDIRIGTILMVTVVDGADKLLQLSVDVGEETPRQIISGIREFFPDPSVLVGRQCPFLVNLASRRIRGLESQGMILAADAAGTFALLQPHQPLPPGTAVH